MARDDNRRAAPACALAPQISLMGGVTEAMARSLRDELRNLPSDDGPVAIEMTTLGGDAELARRMVRDIDDARRRLAPRRLVFVGKTVVYSAGVTVMSAFPREDRFLTADAMLLIHCRQLDKTVEVSGPIRASLPQVEALCHQLRIGVSLETQNFERLIEGSSVRLDDLLEKALYNWYVPADEAVELGLVAGILDDG